MAATFVEGGGGYSLSGSQFISIDLPVIASGHTVTVVITIQDDFDTQAVTPPSGWTLRDSVDPGQGSVEEDSPRSLFYTKKPAGGQSAQTETWELAASKQWSYGYWVTTEDYSTHTKTAFAGPSATWTVPAVTAPTVAATDALWVQVPLPAWYARSMTPPGGTTEMTDVEAGANTTSYTSVAAGYKAVGTGSTGTGAWTADVSGGYAALSIIYTTVVSGSTFTISGGGEVSFITPGSPTSGPLGRNPFGLSGLSSV